MKAYPIKVRGKYGLIDRQGNVVIDPIKYDMIGSAVNGRALAFQSGDWFLIDGARVTGMPPEATYMFNSYGESVFLAEDEDYLGGYIDSAGRWSIERRFREARSFHFGMAVVKDGNDTKFKVIDTKGGDVFAAEWDGISDFSESGAAARKGDKRFLLKHSGESFEMDGAEDMHAPSEGVVACSMRGAGRKSWKFFDVESRSLLFEEGFASVHRFASGLCGVRSGKEYQFVNMKGARINDFVYKDTGVFHQGGVLRGLWIGRANGGLSIWPASG